MKKLLLSLFVLMLTVATLFAQAPQKMSYQAVVRNANNTLVTNQNVSAKISIIQGSMYGTPVYVETHSATTNANGLLTIEVGEGTVLSGTMAAINWANGPFYLKSEIDPTGGNSYTIEGVQELMSVPYALYASAAGNVPAIAIAPVDTGYMLTITYPGGQPQSFFLANGTPGPQGPAGPQGDPGQPGQPGQDGRSITSITGPVTNGLVDTYTIHFSDNTSTNFTVTNGAAGAPGQPGAPGQNGRGIVNITGPVTSGLVDTYTINYSDNTTSTFTVTNGADGQGGQGVDQTLSLVGTILTISGTGGNSVDLSSIAGSGSGSGQPGADGVGIDSIAKTNTVGLVDTYTIYYSNNTTATFTVTNGANGADGADGADGAPGAPGAPGFSPTITVTQGPAGMVLTITDVTGSSQYTIPNGGGSGSGGTLVQQQVNWNETDPTQVTYILNKPNLAAVAISGAYSDLTGTPTLAPVAISGAYGDLTGTPTLAPVATSGNYNDLNNKPDLSNYLTVETDPTVSNATITIQKNGTTVDNFSLNQSGNKTINITVPTQTSELNNNSGFITSAAVPTLSVTQTETGYVLTVTQPGGAPQNYTLNNGTPGTPGAPGNDGTDGRGIQSIVKTGSTGNVDHYKITYTDNTEFLYDVTNGEDGADAPVTTFTYGMNADSTILYIYKTVSGETTTWQIPVGAGGSGGTQLQSSWSENDPTSPAYIIDKPSNVSAFTNDAGYLTTETDPSVNNATITIQKNGTTVDNFTLNQSENKAINITVPTKTSDLTNDNGFITSYTETDPTVNNATINIQKNGVAVGSFTANQSTEKTINIQVPTKTSDLTNDNGYLTTETDPTVNNPTITIQKNGTNLDQFTLNQSGNKTINITVPTKTSDLTNDNGFISSYTETDPTVNNATVAIRQGGDTLGVFTTNQNANSYVDIPAVNNATITIKQDGALVGAFTANESVDQVINISSPAPEYQVLSISNDTIYLSNGGYVKLPEAFSGDYNDLLNRPDTLSHFLNDVGYITSAGVPAQVQSDWEEADMDSKAFIKNKPTIPTIPTNVSAFTNDEGYITASDVQDQVQSDWNVTDGSNIAYIKNKPDMNDYAKVTDLSNFVNMTDDQTINGNKTFIGDVTLQGDNAVNVTGSLEVPSVLNNIDNSNGTLNLSNYVGTGDCEQAVNFCDLQTVYTNILNKFNDLNDQIDDLLDSIHKLNKELKTPKDGAPCPNTPMVIDVDSNVYSTVRIGNQCWMRENLRVTHWPNGTAVTAPTTPTLGALMAGLRYSFTDVMANNAAAPTSEPTQGICPAGWRVPSDADFNELKAYAQAKVDAAGALMATVGWTSALVDNQNALGMSFIPNNSVNYCELVSTNQAEWDKSSNSSYPFSRYTPSGSVSTAKLGVRCIRAHSNGESVSVFKPTVVTIDSIKNIQQDRAWILGGEITDNGGMPITRFGVAVGTSADFTLSHNFTSMASQADYNPNIPYTMYGWTVAGLTTNTNYYYRAFAINAVDTAYGEAIAFKTVQDGLPCPGFSTNDVTDASGNTYNTVMIGTQCWLKENVKATRYANNWPIAEGSNTSETIPYCQEASINVANGAGRLYNFAAVMNGEPSTNADPSTVLGVCPAGWHVPSTAEFDVLVNYVKSKDEYKCNGSSIVKALAANTGWTSSATNCAPGNNQASNNATGFTALQNHSYYADYWTATQGNWYFSYAEYDDPSCDVLADKSSFYGVRCVKDAGTTPTFPKRPAVTLTDNGNSTDNAYAKRVTAEVTNTGSSAITARYVFYVKSSDAAAITGNDVALSVLALFNGVEFTDATAMNCCKFSDMEPNTEYKIYAMALNSEGLVVSDPVTFTTPAEGSGMRCPGTPSVQDVMSNTYPTVKLGTQCWMAQNLRTTQAPDGTSISTLIPNGAGSVDNNFGRLYTPNVSKNGSSTSTGEVQGVCPTGWHLPSETEFQTLNSYMGTQDNYKCDGYANNIAKALASNNTSSDYLWSYSSSTCAVGNDVASNNASGFNAYPAGYYAAGYVQHKASTWFMTSTLSNTSTKAYAINHNSVGLEWGTFLEGAASVRCVQGATPPAVSTSTSSSITSTSATVSGKLISDGINTTFNASSVTEVGICYGTSNDPTISDSKKTTTIALGNFSVNLTGLTSNTTYYYRTYATNANGTQYGEVKSFTTKNGAKVNTNTPDNVTTNGARLKGYLYPHDATITGWGFYLYKQNSDGTYPVNATYDLYRESTSASPISWNGITYTFTSSPQSGMYYFNITSGLQPGATYKVVAQIKSTLDGQSEGWHTTSNVAGGAPIEKEFTTKAAPEVSTTGAYLIDGNFSYYLRGTITNQGNPKYTKIGFVRSTTNAAPTLRAGQYTWNSEVTSGSWPNALDGTGTFSKQVNPGNMSTTYYYRAYAINEVDTVYGVVKSFTTPNIPDVSFQRECEAPYYYSQYVNRNSITLEGYFHETGSYVGWDTLGLVYSTTNTTPTFGVDNFAPAVKSDGNQFVTMLNLQPNQTYYVRAYARNKAGMEKYSSTVKSVKTAVNCGNGLLTDQSGYTYQTVKIGSHCWMKTNLKAVRYDDQLEMSGGTYISQPSGTTVSNSTPYRYAPTAGYYNVGYYYNLPAARGMGNTNYPTGANMMTFKNYFQGVCPRGWHLPSYAEFTTLLSTNPSLSEFNSQYAGYFNASGEQAAGSRGEWWSNSLYSGTSYYYLYKTIGGSGTNYEGAQIGKSVRCIQDISY